MNEQEQLEEKPTQAPLSMYEQYIHLDVLLNLQHEENEQLHPDDLLFQVVHQTIELWWKVTMQLLTRATDQINGGNLYEAAQLINRANEAQKLVIQTSYQLEKMEPLAFLTLRPGLGDASGASSPGFKMIRRFVPTLWNAFSGILKREQVELLEIYLHSDIHSAFYSCAEALLDFDEQIQFFRAAHLRVAKRYLGPQATGTGGSSMKMLERTQQISFFPQLWEVRSALLIHMEQDAAY